MKKLGLSLLALVATLSFSAIASAEDAGPDRTGWINGGMTFRFGSGTGSFGLNVGYQHRIPLSGDDHSLIVGPRLVLAFPSFIGPEISPGGEIGYRGNFVHGQPFRAGIVAMLQPAFNLWVGGPSTVTALSLPVVGGGFFKYGPFEGQLTGGAGPAIGFGKAGTTSGFGVVNINAGYAF